MCEGLPAVSNPDLFYYACYRLWPNKATQVDMSEIFPRLCAQYDVGGVDNTILESFKPRERRPMKPREHNLKNYFYNNLPLPAAHSDSHCSEEDKDEVEEEKDSDEKENQEPRK
ncbi:unnamed protein product [Caenorhabditis sp. 36 PRJEB53466]|nr:unnamed protein product [Caenorhabditis sp. 36 PRJEB53466]